jgi:plastocyanin
MIIMALALISSVRAGVVIGNVRDAGLVAQATNIYFTPKSTPMADSPSVIISAVKTATSDTNGDFSITLAQGNYKVQVGSNTLDSFLIAVPSGFGTNNWTSVTVGTLTYKYPFSPVYLDRSIVSSRGDLWGYDGTNITRVPIGNWGQVMIANSNFTHGLGWTNISAAITNLGSAAYSNATAFQAYSTMLDWWATQTPTWYQMYDFDLAMFASVGTNGWISTNGGTIKGNLNVSGNINTNISTTEFNYLDGLTNNIQIQLNSKNSLMGSAISNLIVGLGGTNAGTGIVYFDTPNNASESYGAIMVNKNGTPVGMLCWDNASRATYFDGVGDIFMRSGYGGTTAIVIKTNRNIGFGLTSPTAVLHLKAGTATANTAPLKFSNGTLTATPEAGALEMNNTGLFWTGIDGNRINLTLGGSASNAQPPSLTLSNLSGVTTNMIAWIAQLGSAAYSNATDFQPAGSYVTQGDTVSFVTTNGGNINSNLTFTLNAPAPDTGTNYVLDFGRATHYIAMTANVNFTSSTNRPAEGREVFSTFTMINRSGGNLNVTYPASWIPLGNPPTVCTNGRALMISASAIGNSETNVVYGAAN